MCAGILETDRCNSNILDPVSSWRKFFDGVSPYEIFYGRPARGILAALKETWTGEQVFPSTLAYSTKTYLDKLREDLEFVKTMAEENSRVNEAQSTHRYNLRNEDKSF